MVIVSKMSHVYVAKTGDFIFPGANSYPEDRFEKLIKSEDVIEAAELKLFNIKKVQKEVDVKITDNDTAIQKSAKAIMSMSEADALKVIADTINLEVLFIVSKNDKRASVKMAADSVVTKVTSEKKSDTEESF
jgi:hypothetical protein